MAYKKITKTGENFIRTVCIGNGNSLLSGRNNYRLNFGYEPKNTLYTALPKDRNGIIITENSKLGEELIYWFNKYSEQYNLDANIIAAQAFIESKYKLWAFPPPKLGSSAQGISQFISSTLYDVAIANFGVSRNVSILFTDEEKNRITNGLIDGDKQASYIYNKTGSKVAEDNRSKLFQNCMNNPDLMIKAQCKLMKGISYISANNAASTLFGYNQGSDYVKSTITLTLKNAESRLSVGRYNDGLLYIDKIFRVLGDKDYSRHKQSGIWFGYDIDFSFDSFVSDSLISNSDNTIIDLNMQLSLNYKLIDFLITSSSEKNIPNKSEIEKLKIFADTILEPLNKYFNTVFIVNSAFRSEKVNADPLVKGTIYSQHRLAEAADIRLDTENPLELFLAFNDIIKNDVVPYDQIIYETKGNSVLDKWIHISYKSNLISVNRKEALTADFDGTKMVYKKYSI